MRVLEAARATLEARVQTVLLERDALRLAMDDTAADSVAAGKRLRSLEHSIKVRQHYPPVPSGSPCVVGCMHQCSCAGGW